MLGASRRRCSGKELKTAFKGTYSSEKLIDCSMSNQFLLDNGEI